MAYKQLTYEQRCRIYGLWRTGHTQTKIADEIGVHKSTISRELKRNITYVRTSNGYWQYKPDYAQTYANERHRDKPKAAKLTQEVRSFICDKLREEWSPEQVSGYAKRHGLFKLSHEWIYRLVLQDKQKGGDLYKHLRHQHKKYRKRYGSPKRENAIRNRRSIEERPAVVDEKIRIGDWEIDTIIGKQQKQAIVSIVERKSKFTVLRKVKRRTAESVANAVIPSLKGYEDRVLTITADNGREFSWHEKISNALGADFFFAHPYSSWERGLNENTNGLVRQYLKKGSDFSSITDDKLIEVANKLNKRPRKTLDYQTPRELFFDNQ